MGAALKQEEKGKMAEGEGDKSKAQHPEVGKARGQEKKSTQQGKKDGAKCSLPLPRPPPPPPAKKGNQGLAEVGRNVCGLTTQGIRILEEALREDAQDIRRDEVGAPSQEDHGDAGAHKENEEDHGKVEAREDRDDGDLPQAIVDEYYAEATERGDNMEAAATN